MSNKCKGKYTMNGDKVKKRQKNYDISLKM